jgi:DNA-directed RNA polymerase sigma subunit (sigma70/sigma32)
MQRADLHQAGMVGLLVAADRFDPGRGVPFRAFARHWVRKEV